jgi:MOSC domain-containing protein YiiM
MWPVDAVLLGKVATFTDDGQTSAIGKRPTPETVIIGPLGIEGDEQADRSVHGGPDKAIHHYPRDHYAAWRDRIGPNPLLDAPGAFGENVSTSSLIENEACIGDRYRLGTTLVEISQGRQPCWKQAHRFGVSTVPAVMVRTQQCGWYYRVIEAGKLTAGDVLLLVDRPYPEFTVAETIALLIGTKGRKDLASVERLANLELLSESWRARAAAIANSLCC